MTDGKASCARWRAWIADMVKKYEWEIEPDDALYPTIHGLGGAGTLLRRAAGRDVDQSRTIWECRARWSNATCAFATRWRSQRPARRNYNSYTAAAVDGLDREQIVA
jgi:hypothetical protein